MVLLFSPSYYGVGGMRCFKDLNKTDVILSLTVGEDLEVAACMVLKVTSWKD